VYRVTAGTESVVVATCLKCGEQWLPGSERERQLRVESGQTGVKAQQAVLQKKKMMVDIAAGIALIAILIFVLSLL